MPIYLIAFNVADLACELLCADGALDALNGFQYDSAEGCKLIVVLSLDLGDGVEVQSI
jgi:hypothetical protein